MVVSKLRWICASIAIAIVLGCSGGGTSKGKGTVSGNVADLDGNPVRHAKVYPTKDPNTFTYSNSSGAFTLANVPEGDPTIAAELVIGGVSYYGENILRVFEGEPSKNMNIVMGRRDRMGRLTGTVSDRFGNHLEGARVFANNGSLGSVVALTDKDGKYTMFLHSGYTYSVVAGALGYDSDSDSVLLVAGQALSANYVLSNPTDVGFGPPQNFSAVAWTSPKEATQSPKAANTYEAIKRMIDPRRAQHNRDRRPLNTIGGNWIEVDLYWDPIQNLSLLGYGIYRGTSATGATKGIEFLRDPLAGFFADADPGLRQGVPYYYEITALNVNYPDTNNSESGFSDRWGVQPLGDMTLKSVTGGTPVTFNWNTASGAERYTVYLFDQYPDYAVDPIWPVNQSQTNDATTTATSLRYVGPALGRGTYYYIVLGQDRRNGNVANTISRIGSFFVN